LIAVERDGGAQIRQPCREHVDDPAAVAESDRTDLPSAFRPLPQVVGRGDEVVAGLRLFELRKQRARLVFVAGISAEWRKRIGSERDKVVDREPPCDVLDVRIQSTVLVNDEDARQLAFRVRRHREVAPGLGVSLRRRVLDGLGLDPLVVFRNLLGSDELRIQLIEQHRRGHPSGRILRSALQEPAPVERAVHVLIEQIQQPLVEILGRLPFHAVAPTSGKQKNWKRDISAVQCCSGFFCGLRMPLNVIHG
jgi:hypothetical protein